MSRRKTAPAADFKTTQKTYRTLLRNCREYIQDIRAWLIAVLAAERITTTVIRGTHLGAAHDVPRE